MKHQRSWPFAALLTTCLFAGILPMPASGASVEVRLQLPQRARLNLQGRDTIAVSPFLVVTQEGEGADRLQGRDIDVQQEFERYLLKILRRETELKIIEPGPVDYPVYDFSQLAKQQDFWQALGERTQADLILAGGLDFDIQDRSGYQMQEYVSPFNGRTYYRSVLVEQTGFEYDIIMQVYDGKTGELLYQDNFKDFQSFEGEGTDPLAGMFENLLSLEDRILNVFTQKEVEATRLLFTQ